MANSTDRFFDYRLSWLAFNERVLQEAADGNNGSGEFGVKQWKPLQVSIRDCPLCRGAVADTPLCDFYTGTFERLFRTLVSKKTQVQEVACGAMGEPACLFEMRW